MKKSVILIIGILFVASVFMVGLMYPKMDHVKETKYVKKIVYTPQADSVLESSNENETWYTNDTLGVDEALFKNPLDIDGVKIDAYVMGKYKEGFTLLLEFEVAEPEGANIVLDGIVGNEFSYSIGDTAYNEETGEGIAILEKTADGMAKLTFKRDGMIYLTVTSNDGGGAKYVVCLFMQ